MDLGKIEILHPQKHLFSYGYDWQLQLICLTIDNIHFEPSKSNLRV